VRPSMRAACGAPSLAVQQEERGAQRLETAPRRTCQAVAAPPPLAPTIGAPAEAAPTVGCCLAGAAFTTCGTRGTRERKAVAASRDRVAGSRRARSRAPQPLYPCPRRAHTVGPNGGAPRTPPSAPMGGCRADGSAPNHLCSRRICSASGGGGILLHPPYDLPFL
jgi:hypothetical protein